MTPVTKDPDVVEAEVGEAAPEARRGRPREEDRTPLILRAAMELVDEAGYDDLRIKDVAERAGVGLATIYRRWPTKKELFLDALRNKDFDLPTTGDARADLTVAFRRMAQNVSGGSRLAVGCLAAEATDPELLEEFRAVGVFRLHEHLRTVIAGAVGDDDPDIDLRADLGPGLIVQRSLLCGVSTDDDAFIERLVALTLGPYPSPTTPLRAKRATAKKAKPAGR